MGVASALSITRWAALKLLDPRYAEIKVPGSCSDFRCLHKCALYANLRAQQCLIAVRRRVAAVSCPKVTEMVEDTQTDHSEKLIVSRSKELVTNSVYNWAREHTDSERKGPAHSFLCAQTHSGPLF